MWKLNLRDPDVRSGTRITLLVLIAGLALSAFLVYQTLEAHRSHRAAVDLGVQNVSVLIADRVLAPITGDWFTAASAGFAPLFYADGSGEVDPPPEPSTLSVEALVGQSCGCSLAPSGGTAFRLDFRSGDLVLGDDEAEGIDLDALRAQLGRAASVPPSDSTFLRRGESVFISTLLVHDPEETYAVPFLFLHVPDEGFRWAYGFVVPAGDFLSGSLEALADLGPRILPREMTGGLEGPILASAAMVAEDHLVLAETRTAIPSGSTPGPETYASGFRAGNVLGQLRLRVALHPEFLERIPIGESSADRTWLYILLLAMNAILVGVALLQLQRERAFLRRRTEFIAGFSHEARNPLATIRLYAQGLRFGRITPEEKRERALDIIDRESRRLVHLVSNFLNHGAGEEKTLRLQPRLVELTNEVRTFAASLRSELRERRARLELELPAEAWVRADPTALQQILRNVVDNALKYGPPGQCIRIGLSRLGDVSLLQVEDEGPGIPESEREAIFRPFVRTPAAIRSGAGGSGLGLSVVRELVSLQGGFASAEPSRRGRGARLVIGIPAVANGPRASEADGSEAKPSSPVDDPRAGAEHPSVHYRA